MKTKLLFAFITILGVANGQGTWTKKANFPGVQRYDAVSFSIGKKGYIGTGGDATYNPCKDFWEWDQINNAWTQKADFPGTARYNAVGFSIGNKGYIGFGGNKADFWEWDQGTNIWTEKDSLTFRNNAIGFSIGNKGYIGTGSTSGSSYSNTFWEYDPASDSWTQKANLGGVGRTDAVGFVIGNKGYIGTGIDGNASLLKDFWEYDPAFDVWTQKADFGGGVRNRAVGFSIGTKGFIGTGSGPGPTFKSDFWEWDQSTNQWSQIGNFNGGKKHLALSISIGNSGYIGLGFDSLNVLTTEFWEFNNACGLSTPSICMVTVDSTNKNVVIWEKAAFPEPIDSFRIYREVSSTYSHIKSVPYSSLSTYTDVTNGVNPNTAASNYKISTVDTCGIESALSAYHKTIHVAISPAVPCGYNLIWNDYIGLTLTQYLIYKDSAKTGWKVVDSLSFGNTSWTDGTCYSSNDTIAYLIEAVNPAGCNPTIKKPSMAIASTRSNIQQNMVGNSIQELSKTLFTQVAPNPFSTETTLKFDKNLKNASLTIYNCLGQTVKRIDNITGDAIIFYRDNLPSGLYFIHLTQDRKTFTTDKLVIADL